MKVKKELIKNLIKQKSLKQREVAIEIGVTPQNWNNWMFRGVFPHFKNLQDLANLLEVDTDDLLIEKILPEPNLNLQYQGAKDLSPIETIPYYDLDAHTALRVLHDENASLTPNDRIYIPGIAADFVLPYYGKEMEPVISNGDLIIIRKIDDDSFFNFGNIYLVTTKEHVITRYIKPGKEEGQVILSALNSESDDIEIPTKKLESIYLLVSTIRRQVI